MSYRYTNTEKWTDSWFANLRQIEMLLFIYLCDNCDIAGFIEVNYKRWSADLSSSNETLEGASQGLSKGLIRSEDGSVFYIKNFLKHQKNLPLNENNNAHLGILRRFEAYRLKFNIQDVYSFIEAPDEGLTRGYGKGNGKGNGLGNELGNEKNWKSNFEIYKRDLLREYEALKSDQSFIAEQEKFYPNVDIPLSLEKAVTNYWSTSTGWKKKKSAKIKEPDWKSTLTNAISMNKVYKPKETAKVEYSVSSNPKDF